ncbi:hypothetical protein [Christiangramia forsetii]|uniref:Membrane metalloprotease n=2 Tax=Christiangramia forsetii TaxID=411153 RepID=A0M416_CHRFK|nr:hypothetical protein [Christiangramia forsetii]GGG24461.1 hypothetical protein GCM10011532_04670 [Christiangramia forsetii]CAL67361.1 conserved hypothetical protein, secreted [Christiangramia forsetii KT0803]
MIRFKKLFIFFFAATFILSCSKDSPNRSGDGSIDRTANLKSLGSSASDLLNDATFTSLNIEIVYVEGNRPTEEGINLFRNFLQSRIYKPDGIKINLRSANSSGKAPFTIEEIVDIEKEERTSYNVGDEIAVWIYFADGSNEKDTNEKFVLGSAFRNTSMVIYERTIREFANRTGAPNRATIEAATLNHEFSHLFGLVNLGTTPVTDHEDPENDGHCIVDGCLMRSSIEFGSGVVNIIDGSGIPTLDDACIQDLQSIGGR